jgi:hypothetical protein
MALPTEPCVGSELAKVQGVLETKNMEATDRGRSEIVFDLHSNEIIKNPKDGDKGRVRWSSTST